MGEREVITAELPVEAVPRVECAATQKGRGTWSLDAGAARWESARRPPHRTAIAFI